MARASNPAGTTAMWVRDRLDGLWTANCLWPATLVATAAVRNIVAGDDGIRASRRPEIVADSAAVLLTRPAADGTGQCYLDEEILRASRVIDLSGYAYDGTGENQVEPDLFL